MKRKLLILLTFIFLFGCSSNQENVKSSDQIDIDNTSNLESVVLSNTAVYSDDRLWVDLNTEDGVMKSAIDKKGNVIVGFYNYPEVSDFEDGYSSVAFKDYVHHINKKGEIISTIEISENQKIVCYGGGYTVVESHTSDFETNEYTYTIYGHDGNELTTYAPGDGEEHSVYYMKNGVFNFRIYTEEGWTNDIYFSKSNKWVRQGLEHEYYFDGNNDLVVGCESGENGTLIVLTNDGDVKKIVLPFSPTNVWSIQDYSIISGDYCMIIDSNNLYILNMITQQMSGIEEKYIPKINWESNNFNFIGDVMSIPLVGEDGNLYVGLFGIDGKIIEEPLMQSGYTFSDEMLVTYTGSLSDTIINVYTKDGKKAFDIKLDDISTHEFNRYNNIFYNDGVYVDTVGSKIEDMKIYDKEGNILFNKLKTDNTIVYSKNESK